MDRRGEPDAQPAMSAEEQLAKMRAGKRTTGDISMGGYKIVVRVLSAAEIDSMRVEAKRLAATRGADEATANLEIQRMTLKLATTLSKGGAPQLGDKVLSMMTLDELTYLYEEWVKFMDSVNPSVEHIQPEDFRKLVDALKKNIVSPKDLSLLHLKAICSAYVDLIQRQENPI